MDTASKSSKQSRASTKASPAKAKPPTYISFNDQELDRLRQLGFRERWAYVELKKISNWKAGTCGEFDRQCLSYVQIAKLVTAPDAQGRGNGKIDDTQARDFLERMEAVGLVANIGRRANGGLRFDMPMSPIHRDKAGQSGEVVGITSGKMSFISPDHIEPQTPAKPAPAMVCDELPPSLSVMINKEINISNDGAGSADADAAPCRVSDAAPVREIVLAPLPAAAPLTAREIQLTIEGDFTYFETATPEAQELYRTWAQAGITLEDLQNAMISLDEDVACPELTPTNLKPKLWAKVVDGWFDRMAD